MLPKIFNATTPQPIFQNSSILNASSTPNYIVTPDTLVLSSEHERHGGHNSTGGNQPSESLVFILIPLLIVLGVALLSGLAVYCVQRRRRLDNLRHTLIPLYTFSRADEDEWGVLLDNCNSQNEIGERNSYRR